MKALHPDHMIQPRGQLGACATELARLGHGAAALEGETDLTELQPKALHCPARPRGLWLQSMLLACP